LYDDHSSNDTGQPKQKKTNGNERKKARREQREGKIEDYKWSWEKLGEAG